MAKVLLADTNFSSAPIYQELISMGHDVHVVGNNPSDYLAKVSPNYWNINYSDTNALKALVDKNEYDFLVPGCTDLSYRSCAAVNHGRFPGFDNIDTCNFLFNKDQFRRLAKYLDLPSPMHLKTGEQTYPWPIIIKPVDSFSGKGITVVHQHDMHTFNKAITTASEISPTGEYVIETFVEGQLYSHSAFIKNGQIVQDFIVQEDSTANPFTVDTSRVTANIPTGILISLRYCTENIAQELKLADGLLHTQFICKGNDFWLIEITRRCPGDLYSQLIELTTGYPYTKSYIMPFLGIQVQDTSEELCCDPIIRHTVTCSGTKYFSSIHFNRALHIETLIPLNLSGNQLSPNASNRIGILFCRGSDEKNFNDIYETILQRKLYEILT